MAQRFSTNDNLCVKMMQNEESIAKPWKTVGIVGNGGVQRLLLNVEISFRMLIAIPLLAERTIVTRPQMHCRLKIAHYANFSDN